MRYSVVAAFLVAVFFTAGIAQTTVPEIPEFESFTQAWNFVTKIKENREEGETFSYGLVFMKIKGQLRELEIKKEEYDEAGMLFHYAQMHDKANEALEHYLADNPHGLTPEIAAMLVDGSFHEDHLAKTKAWYGLYMQEFGDDTGTYEFGFARRIDEVEHAMFIMHFRHGEYEDAIQLMNQMYDRRDRDNPQNYNFSSTLFHLGSKALMELGRYDQAVEMLKRERAKLAQDSTIGQYADYYRVLVEHRRIIEETEDYRKAEAYLESQAELFTNKYAKRKFDTSLAHARLLGKQMTPLTVTDVIQPYPGIDLTNLDGKVVVLDFWATWCHACIEGFPHMNKLMHEYEDDGLAIIGITKAQGRVSGMENLAGIPLQYAKELELTKKLVKEYPRYKMDYAVVMDREGESLEAYGVGFLPTIVIIDREKTIRWIGHPIGVEFDRMLERVLAE